MSTITGAKKKLPKKKVDLNEKRDDEAKYQDNLNQVEFERMVKEEEERKKLVQDQEDNENLPEILKKADPTQKANYQRTRMRNFADGAISINLQLDDLFNENPELYDNKGNNLQPYIFNDQIFDKREAFVESLRSKKYFKIKPDVKIEQELPYDQQEVKAKRELKISKEVNPKSNYQNRQSIEGKPDVPQEKFERKRSIADQYTPGSPYQKNQNINKTDRKFGKTEDKDAAIVKYSENLFHPKEKRTTEEEIFEKFAHEMNQVILRISNKIAVCFLFAQGILAGIALTNLILLFEFPSLLNFTNYYILTAKDMFNFIYLLTFISLIGNGVKCMNSYKKKKSVSGIFGAQDEIARLKRSLLISIIIFIFYLISFSIQLYQIGFIPTFNYARNFPAVLALITENVYSKYSVTVAIVCALSLISFLINILDVEQVEQDVNLTNSVFNFEDDTSTANTTLN